MTNIQELMIPELTSDRQAMDLGYEEGRRLREYGAKPQDLAAQREINYEGPFPSQRGPGNPFYGSWRRGFDAGYLDDPKP